MRGVINMLVVTFFLVGFTIFAPAALGPLSREVIAVGNLSSSSVQTIDDLNRALNILVPLVAFFGTLAFGVAWYMRDQITINER